MGSRILLAFQASLPFLSHTMQILGIKYSEGKGGKWQLDLGLWEEAILPFDSTAASIAP